MKVTRYIQNLLFILFVVYYAQGSLYEQGSIVSQGVLLLFLAISAFYLVKTLLLTNNKNTFYKAWTALLILNIIGFIFTSNINDSRHFGMFKEILICSLSFYPFFYFSSKGILKAKHLIIFFILMLPLTILQYYFNATQILSSRVSNNTDLVNNVAYSFVALIPFVFLIKRKLLAAIVMLLMFYFIIQGAKRGALITGTIGLLVYIYFQLSTVEKKYRLSRYFVVLVSVVVLTYFTYDVLQDNEFLIARFGTGGASGRDIIYANIFNTWYSNDASLFNLIFGFGFASSLRLSGTGHFAHNDWLELLSNFGLLGVGIYTIVFYAAIKYLRNKMWCLNKRLLLMAILSMWFMSSLFSMFYTSTNAIVSIIILGYLFGSKSDLIE